MYKKIKSKYKNLYYKCPVCYKIIRLDNKYHNEKCRKNIAEYIKILDENKGGR